MSQAIRAYGAFNPHDYPAAHPQLLSQECSRILVADGSTKDRSRICRELGERGATTIECGGRSELRRYLAERHFDLLITELRLTDGSAIDVIEWLRTTHPALRIAVVTAHSSIASVVRCTRLGVCAYLPKPVTTDCLLQAVESVPRSHALLGASLDIPAWSILQALHEQDPEPWPRSVPTDPEHHLWTFCFAGMQLFTNFSAPGHVENRARNLGDSLVLVVNPRENCDVVAGNNPQGLRVRKAIRRRIARYNGGTPSDHLGTYGDPSNREWQQYAASDVNTPLPGRCPFSRRT